jgi:hypothetical protein
MRCWMKRERKAWSLGTFVSFSNFLRSFQTGFANLFDNGLPAL